VGKGESRSDEGASVGNADVGKGDGKWEGTGEEDEFGDG
jgi:hypothetical protein